MLRASILCALPVAALAFFIAGSGPTASSLGQASAAALRSGVAPDSGPFNHVGNILIADQFNNRVIEVNPADGRIVWHFGDGSSVAGPHSIVGTNDAERFKRMTLIAGTGAPSGSEPTCMGSMGCPDNRVIVVDEFRRIVWQYGQAGVGGSGFNQLNTPVAATVMPNSDVLITDQVNERVIQVAPKTHKILWQYGTTGVAGSGPNQLSNPNSAELLENGHILIADENNNRVIEVDQSNNAIKWQYPVTPDPKLLNGAAFASRLPNGHTLITDSNNNRIIEVDKSGNLAWSYATNARKGSIANPLPTRAVRLRDTEDTLISDQFNHQVFRVRKDGTIVWSLGTIGVSGKGLGLLNAPYDAKVIGQYVGLTPPPGYP
jgi:hypothetical protein